MDTMDLSYVQRCGFDVAATSFFAVHRDATPDDLTSPAATLPIARGLHDFLNRLFETQNTSPRWKSPMKRFHKKDENVSYISPSQSIRPSPWSRSGTAVMD
jgi:hypothetical protein